MTDEYDFEADAGIGLENVRQDDLLLPQIKLLQGLSKECRPRDAAYVPDAAEGKWLDVVRSEIFDEFIFVPCRYERQFIEWKPREDGGGMVRNWGGNDHRISESTSDEIGRWITPEGHEVIPTPTYYGYRVGTIIKRGEDIVPCSYQAMLTLAATQAKVSARWISMHRALQVPKKDGSGNYSPPLYYLAYKISCVGQQNDKGSWVIPTVERYGLTSELYPKLIGDFKDFAKLTEGEKFQRLTLARGDDERESGGPRPRVIDGGRATDDEIPF